MTRAVCLLIGILTLVFAWAGPLPEKTSVSFAAHMTLHMLVVAIAAPLLAIGLSGWSELPGSWDPVEHLPWLFPPILASVVEMIAVWAWHAPALHHFARDSASGFIVEQSCFLLSGLWLWLSAVGGQPSPARVDAPRKPSDPQTATGSHNHQRQAAGVLALLLTSMHMTLLGALLIFAPRLLFVHEVDGTASHVIHAEHMFQQQLGGAIMLIIGGAAYLAGGIALTRRMLPAERVQALEAESA